VRRIGRQWEPTLLVQLALVEFDEGLEERLLLAGQWLWHGAGRVSEQAWSVEEVPPTSNSQSELRRNSATRTGNRLGWEDVSVGTTYHRDMLPSTISCM
jgi:hypothetical protein